MLYNKHWIGGASPAVAQVWKGNITTTTTGHTYTATITDESGATYVFSYALVSGDTTTTIAAASWAAAWNASTEPRTTPMTATSSGNTVILTADSAGVPFYVTATGGTGTWSGTGNTTSNVGPADFNTPGNWAENAVPVATNNVLITGGRAIKYGLDQDGYAIAEFARSGDSTAQIGSYGKPLKLDLGTLAIAGSGPVFVQAV